MSSSAVGMAQVSGRSPDLLQMSSQTVGTTLNCRHFCLVDLSPGYRGERGVMVARGVRIAERGSIGLPRSLNEKPQVSKTGCIWPAAGAACGAKVPVFPHPVQSSVFVYCNDQHYSPWPGRFRINGIHELNTCLCFIVMATSSSISIILSFFSIFLRKVGSPPFMRLELFSV